MTTSAPETLDELSLRRGLEYLSRRDPDLARIYKTLGVPPMWSREPGFAALVRIILGQQVSLSSADATFQRLLAASASPLTPRSFLSLSDAVLRSAGFSRQKIAYCRHLSQSIIDGQLSLDALARMDDTTAKSELLKIKGIGQWTADIYLLMVLGRPDVWPAGDLALAIAAQKVKRLPTRPTYDELITLGAAWQPWRAVAARLLWHYYLTNPS